MLFGALFLLILIIIMSLSFVIINGILTHLHDKYIGKSHRILKYLFLSILAFLVFFIIMLLIVASICFWGDYFLSSPLRKLHNAPYQNMTLLISIFIFLISNFIFSIPKFLSLDAKYTFTENARFTQLFISLGTAVVPATFYEWLKWHPHGETDISYLAALVAYFSGLFFILSFIAIITMIFFRVCNPFFHWMLQPKSANFANLSSNHYDIDDLLKSEQKYKNPKKALESKLQKLSFKNANNLYK